MAYKDLKAPAKRPKRATTAKKKVVKSAKPVEIEPIVESDDVYRCTCCGHKYKKQETNFSASKSPIYKGNNGYLSLTKTFGRCPAKSAIAQRASRETESVCMCLA